MKELKINLGCGKDFSRDLIGFDIYDYGQQYVGFDMEKDKLPYEDNSVDYVLSNHSLEHLHDVKNIMNETWRVLKQDGEFEIRVPHGLWEGSSKPVHHQLITECWFDFFRKEKTKVYGYKRWKIDQLIKLNNGSEIYCIMNPDK